MNDDVKKRVQETFSRNKEAYVQSKTHNNRTDLELISEWLTPEKDWTVLDIATGGGHVARQLSSSVSTVFATDITKDMLQNTARHLQGFPNIHYVVADAEELPFIDDMFDAVTCRIAPHHFPSPENFIKETARVLKPGGSFLMIDNVAPEDDELDSFYNQFEYIRDPSHCRALKVSEWKRLLANYYLPVHRELARRKQMKFSDWVSRTVKEKPMQDQIERWFINAPEKAKTYFSIIEQNHHIETFEIDEWKILTKKQ
ncbi:class I SAM-dependent methyltransferase [Halobacillus salinarum]|uniref:Class I SAM-dependent methyltransferase n=1 Tax=Halobacillus salinarum TaxID=2932257 RepID=A0ABY4EK65_9BACI|nr:class I SAM-dependent methyltransferase [Halobacillus salinarum]UOQ44491.1 class I SAM-dependent methyltransferase [Halobacillus salinarum]